MGKKKLGWRGPGRGRAPASRRAAVRAVRCCAALMRGTESRFFRLACGKYAPALPSVGSRPACRTGGCPSAAARSRAPAFLWNGRPGKPARWFIPPAGFPPPAVRSGRLRESRFPLPPGAGGRGTDGMARLTGACLFPVGRRNPAPQARPGLPCRAGPATVHTGRFAPCPKSARPVHGRGESGVRPRRLSRQKTARSGRSRAAYARLPLESRPRKLPVSPGRTGGVIADEHSHNHRRSGRLEPTRRGAFTGRRQRAHLDISSLASSAQPPGNPPAE